VLLVLETARADEAALARALSLSAFEASQRRRRGGPDLRRILPAAQAAEEAARLRAEGLEVLEIAEDEVRRAEPVMATRGAAEQGALALDGDGGPLRLAEADLLVIVRGVITREYQTTPEARRQRRLATLDPGYRVHLHRRQDPRPVELIPPTSTSDPEERPAAPSSRSSRAGSTGSFRACPDDLVPGGDSPPWLRPCSRRRLAGAPPPWPGRAARPASSSTTSRSSGSTRLARRGAAPRWPHSLRTMSIDITAARSRRRRRSSGRMLSAMVSM
jgi:hypothetical protein